MKTVKFLLSLGFAAGVGMAIGIVTAPRSGKRTRARLTEEYEDAKSHLEDAANKKIKEAKAILNKTMEKQSEKSKDAMSKLREAIKI
ncbi:MAG: YtxH domain-containing protein [Cyclobacteriaceae bacterium]|nr:YtxH domain-containing protein [Cyclobacteriaceae bacterium]